MEENKIRIVFDAKVTVENKISKQGKIYQIMKIGVVNKSTGEILDIHEVYVKESLMQVIEFIISQNIVE